MITKALENSSVRRLEAALLFALDPWVSPAVAETIRIAIRDLNRLVGLSGRDQILVDFGAFTDSAHAVVLVVPRGKRVGFVLADRRARVREKMPTTGFHFQMVIDCRTVAEIVERLLREFD